MVELREPLYTRLHCKNDFLSMNTSHVFVPRRMTILILLMFSCLHSVNIHTVSCFSLGAVVTNKILYPRFAVQFSDYLPSKKRSNRLVNTDLYFSASSNNDLNVSSTTIRDDPFRDNNGVRPSLHPITINSIAEALKQRSTSPALFHVRSVEKESVSKSTTTMTASAATTTTPLELALLASSIATNSIANRQNTSQYDNMKLTYIEEQTIVGRVVGVIMRFDLLEQLLIEKCSRVPWIQKYNEYSTFGIIDSEYNTRSDQSIGTTADMEQNEIADVGGNIFRAILKDPLLCLNRAECLLALFIHTIEIPQLQIQNVSVPDSSVIDFIDTDKKNVLLT